MHEHKFTPHLTVTHFRLSEMSAEACEVGFRVSVVCLFVCLFVWLVGWLVVYLFVYYCLFIYLSSGAAIQVAGDLGACDLHVLRGELYILFVRLFQR